MDFFALDYRVDLLKMDIEGGEWAILRDPRLPTVGARVIVLERPGEDCPEPQAHDEAIRSLRAAGYTGIEDGPRDLDRDVGVLWAWREDGTREGDAGVSGETG